MDLKILMVILCFFMMACLHKNDRPLNLTPETSENQVVAFDALNELQISTDERNQLYSTFPNLNHDCYPPSRNFIISQSELSFYIKEFINKHCKSLSVDKKEQLAETAALAEKEYNVYLCLDAADVLYEKDNTIPMQGIWVLPNVLGKRDVIINWD